MAYKYDSNESLLSKRNGSYILLNSLPHYLAQVKQQFHDQEKVLSALCNKMSY